MRIAIIGYGKMGKAVHEMAVKAGHTIELIIDASNPQDFCKEKIQNCDVAIEFTTPNTAIANIIKCFELGIPAVTGSTGWHHHLEDVKQKCNQLNGSLLYASNFSIGVNIFFHINQKLAQVMNGFSDYQCEVNETHHTNKLDKPSGTAITIANDIVSSIDRLDNWQLDEHLSKEVLPIYSDRKEDVVGLHSIRYFSPIDEITITHNAYSREGFARGAILAASWIGNKKGVFDIKEMFDFDKKA